MVLFYFCSDLAIRAVKAGLMSVVANVTRWSVAFIRGVVATWVRVQGGWTQVMGDTSHNMLASTVNKLAFVTTCAAVMGVCAVYIKRNL